MFAKQDICRRTVRELARSATKSFSIFIVGLFFLMESDAAYGIDKYRDQLWLYNGDLFAFFRARISTGGSVGGCLAVVGLDTNPPIPGTPVEVYECNTLDSIWTTYRIQENGRLTDYVSIVNNFEEDRNGRRLCLGVQGRDTPRTGSLAEIYYCTPGGGDEALDSQWLPERIMVNSVRPEDPPCDAYPCYQLRNRAEPSLCLGVQGADNHQLGARVEVHPCRGWVP